MQGNTYSSGSTRSTGENSSRSNNHLSAACAGNLLWKYRTNSFRGHLSHSLRSAEVLVSVYCDM